MTKIPTSKGEKHTYFYIKFIGKMFKIKALDFFDFYL